MALSKETQQKLMWLWRDENTVEWIETFLKIADKEGNIVPFVLTDEQKMLVHDMQRENVILKSRQLGISSIVVALSIRACIVGDNVACLLVSHNQSSTNTIFDKLKQQFDSLPDFIKPDMTTNNRQELKFVNNSKITCVTAGNKDIGRGDTFGGIVHLSEFAFWKNPDKQLKSLSQAVSSTGKIIIESTAQGFNKFSDVYLNAKNNENSYKEFFFNWINGGKLFNELYKLSVDKYTAIHGVPLSLEDLDSSETELVGLGATLDQITWRREKIGTDGIDAFNVEYPSTDTDCFLVTGKTLFDSKRIDTCYKALIKDKVLPIPKDNIVGLPLDLQNLYGKSFKMWAIPKVGMKYYIGVDCSEGIGLDSSTAIVLDSNGVEVAQLKNNQLKPYQIADVVDILGRYYNKALLTVEKASGGHSVIERLRYDKNYMNMTKYQSYDEYNRSIWKVGFDTNGKSKSIIINDCREWFEKGLILINSAEVLDEMKVYVANDNGSMGAISGSHDDLVIAMALAIVGMKNSFWYNF